MGKVAVITDSIACLTPEQVCRYRITVLPVSFYHGGRIYRDGVDVTPSQAYELFLQDPDSFKTSAVSPGEFVRAFQHLAESFEAAVCITISSRLSAVYQSAREAADFIREELPSFRVEVVDSGTCAAAEGMVAMAAARAAGAGAGPAEVRRVAEVEREQVGMVAYLDTVEHVYRSGRIPRIASRAGAALNVRPLLAVEGGELKLIGIVRSRATGIKRVLAELRRRTRGEVAGLAVMHAYAPDDAAALRDQVVAQFPGVEVWVTEFSPLMGYVCGTGTLGVTYRLARQRGRTAPGP